jgi:YD repeat-containing protein
VIVRYTLSLDDYVESRFAYRVRMARRRVLFRNLYGLSCLAAILGIYVRLSGYPWRGDVLLLVAGLLLLERALLWRLRAAAVYRSNASTREPVELKIEESNLVRTSAGRNEEIRWANILACHETNNLFLLQLSRDDVQVLPKQAFSPGDLFRFQELRQKELIVKTTRENLDVVLLRFLVSWGLIAIAVMALFIGYVHNFLTQLPRTPQAGRSSVPGRQYQPVAKPEPARPADLRGRGTVYLVPLGTIKSIAVPPLLSELRNRYGLQLQLLPMIPLPAWAENAPRKQFVAEDLITAMKLAYPKLEADPQAIVIGLTDSDMYISQLSWYYAFSFREEERFAVVSSAHLAESEDNKPVGADILQKRLTKVFIRDIGILHYRLQPSRDYGSILYRNIDEPTDLDDVGDDYLQSDVNVRADLHVENGDPCFIVRHYAARERDRPDLGVVDNCNGYDKELDLETVQVDLRYGLLLDQRTDFWIADKNIPLELTRVLRTQDSRSRAFGIGGNHNLNVFLVGDRWPFTWIDLVLENGGRSHFRRSNWGFGYWDARYTNRDMSGSKFAGSRIDWAWPGWTLKGSGMTYEFPDPGGATRPERAALIGIEAYNGARLALVRDAAGNLLRARLPDQYELAFTYDSQNRVTGIYEKSRGRFEYSYDTSGHLARVKDAGQRVTEYGYDEAGRMNRIVQDGKEVCTLRYDGGDRVKSETLGRGRTYLFEYSLDNNGQISRVDITDQTGLVRRVRLSNAEYTLDESVNAKH